MLQLAAPRASSRWCPDCGNFVQMTVTIGSTLLHFKILAELGKGGTGEVWRAQDSKLGRQVAIKLLPAAMAADPERLARLQREAMAVAALNHPNIVTIHSVEEVDDLSFITMELVEGTTLTRQIPQGGMPLKKIFELAVPIADALAAAHERGIIHRDLKPDNIMVDVKGRVKILDFGLAKLIDESAGGDESQTAIAQLTEDGSVVGTLPYMSPERLQAQEVDGRTDIFSLGVILYEMAAGHRPFDGKSLADLTSSILRDQPTPLAEVRRELPRHLARIVHHCLEKDPELRTHAAIDVRNELDHLRREVESGEADSQRDVNRDRTLVDVARPPAQARLRVRDRRGGPGGRDRLDSALPRRHPARVPRPGE